ncbi:TIGR03960 family B12-binding radical SAM protein [Polyangium jinanense]|uniref:TIGR03960 family B12-binding radical SAM protein n=1 Tax=Polyangium jinanense TaxID=2829994 RepID=A0A9X4ANZ5_9BACT|nr:TIGR03960 family B12-binding radical SAM protein [Polyangium jinanense]MDC3953431.1 TIGR03960 family B12-binding radical SAM protein [Polyangium jinanense]MDC3979448.1 TIGR03960 family B12-binding radical SAM protein [Polyangium jinanense]
MAEAPAVLDGHPYAAFLDRVEKPARYTGGEVGSVVKDWGSVEATVCLAFPDVYDIGMSHLGFKILYKLLNDDPRTLAERCYAPWKDVEAELRARNIPLVSLESKRKLRDFDVVGFSLQFELTYTNILLMLDLGGVPLRSSDRGEDDPLVIAGGPVATHPEPVSAFIDAVVIGDGEEKATQVALTWARLKKAGVPRRERLATLAKLGAVYVPSLYRTEVDPETGFQIVQAPIEKGLPLPIDRALVDLDKYPFPAVSPTGGPEAIFDRVSIEIARGCTEGCRFCQAGMIYRPVRERDPEQVVNTVLEAVRASGNDEVSLTALSTADVSCISPLIKKVADKLAKERVSMSVSSLRAYGLEPDLLDELKRVRATGLTFAPEAGTQRMRDVVNKNVTEEQLLETAERIFSRGWDRMKLYSMIGLPTEEDADVAGIVEMGARTAGVGRKIGKKNVEVTVSVSTHVPKPHTPFQWAAMDTLGEVARKQDLLRQTVRNYRNVKLKTHGADASVLEGIFARGDRSLCDVLERAYRNGARFDSWDDRLRLDVWEEAFTHFGTDRSRFLNTIPVTARLPWDHIDVGLEEGFLAREYRKALQNRLSPPCGKVAGTFVHHTNVEDAVGDQRRLVCYDCGVACDMTQMRSERVDFLRRLGANKRLPLITDAPVAAPTVEAPVDGEVDEAIEQAPAPVKKAPPVKGRGGFLYRIRFEKTGAMALLGHLDVVRELPRVFRRVGERMVYTKGFHPKPDMIFSPALSLGVASLDEYADVRLERALEPAEIASLVERMNAASPSGLRFRGAALLGSEDAAISRVIRGARYVLAFARSALVAPPGQTAEEMLASACRAAMAAPSLQIRREIEGIGKVVDVRKYLLSAEVGGAEARAALDRAGLLGDLVTLDVFVEITGSGAAKSSEIAAVICGEGGVAPAHRAIRLELFGGAADARFSPLDLAAVKSALGRERSASSAASASALASADAE